MDHALLDLEPKEVIQAALTHPQPWTPEDVALICVASSRTPLGPLLDHYDSGVSFDPPSLEPVLRMALSLQPACINESWPEPVKQAAWLYLASLRAPDDPERHRFLENAQSGILLHLRNRLAQERTPSRPIHASKSHIVTAFVHGDYATAAQAPEDAPTFLEWLCIIHANLRIGNGTGASDAYGMSSIWHADGDGNYEFVRGRLWAPDKLDKIAPSSIMAADPRFNLSNLMSFVTYLDKKSAKAIADSLVEQDLSDEMLQIVRAEARQPWRGNRQRHLEGLLNIAKYRRENDSGKEAKKILDAIRPHIGPLAHVMHRVALEQSLTAFQRTLVPNAAARGRILLDRIRWTMRPDDRFVLEARLALIPIFSKARRWPMVEECARMCLQFRELLGEKQVDAAEAALTACRTGDNGAFNRASPEEVLTATKGTEGDVVQQMFSLLHRASAYMDLGELEESSGCVDRAHELEAAALREHLIAEGEVDRWLRARGLGAGSAGHTTPDGSTPVRTS